MSKPKACKGCRSLQPYYGNKNKRGDRVVSRYWCPKINGTPKTSLKECKYKEGE